MVCAWGRQHLEEYLRFLFTQPKGADADPFGYRLQQIWPLLRSSLVLLLIKGWWFSYMLAEGPLISPDDSFSNRSQVSGGGGKKDKRRREQW